MKILLACTSIEDYHRDEADDSHYPLGLAYLHTYIEQFGHEVKTLYLNNVSFSECDEKIEETLESFKPDIVGISMMTHSRVSAFKAIDDIHEKYPDMPILLGGIHVSTMYSQIAKRFPYAVAIIGEGEETFKELIEHYSKGFSVQTPDVRGIAYFNGEKVVVTARRPLIEDLNMLPFPKHDLFLSDGKTMANLLTSRGCPYKCSFCVLDHVSRRKVRFRSGKNIVDEVEMVLKNHPTVTQFWLHDDAFMINKARTLEFCEEVIRRGVKTQFVASARFRPISEEVVKKMEQAGFVHVLFGLESGSKKVMDLTRKGITQPHARYGLELFAKTKIKTTMFLITGLVGETEETVQETCDFVQELQRINYSYYEDIGVCQVYPGTEIFEICKASGKMSDDYWLTDKEVPYFTTEFGGEHSLEWLMEMKEKAQKYIALGKILTPEGLLVQRKQIKASLKWVLRYKMMPYIQIIFDTIGKFGGPQILVNLMEMSFSDNEPEKALDYLSLAYEKYLLEQILLQIPNEEQKQEYFHRFHEQRKQDEIDEIARRSLKLQRKIETEVEKKKEEINISPSPIPALKASLPILN